MHNPKQSKILVTGATGLVGAHLVEALVQQGKHVKALYRNTIPQYKAAAEVEWIQCDILNITLLEEAMIDVQQVYHCAAVVSFNPKERELLNATNIEGTTNVVNACLNADVEKLLFVSSVSALGRIRENSFITEEMNWSEETSNSEYGKTKFFAEMEVWRGVGEGLNAVVVNPTIILGTADWNKGSAAIFKNAYKEFPWFTEGVTGFVDVEDLVKAMTLLMESDISNERFIISAENIPYRELFTQIANEFGRRPPHKKVTTFIAALVWRIEAVKGFLTGKQPLLTKETSRTAQAKVYFDNSKLFKYFPEFKYQPLKNSVTRICNEFKKMYNL
ncbi:MAG TPA: NAD-dependent epimerase/dehydratase family protein [Panacibacter sp.]|nr:NAD-dependent epimerase/dehydratase family protein [Panacibacter sp.]